MSDTSHVSNKRKTPTPTTLTPQAKLILDYMMARDDRRITPLAAHTFLGIASITARIAELRKAFGPETVSDEWGEDSYKRRFKAYFLTKAQRAEITDKMKAAANAPSN